MTNSINSTFKASLILNALDNVDRALSTNQLRLATGKKINSASDDPSGYIISKKMEARVRTLLAADDNVGDAQNLFGTLEGGYQSVADILSQMKEKIARFKNGTFGTDERNAIAGEISQLATEIDEIKARTDFNSKKIMNGPSGLWGLQVDKNSEIIQGAQIASGNGTADISSIKIKDGQPHIYSFSSEQIQESGPPKIDIGGNLIHNNGSGNTIIPAPNDPQSLNDGALLYDQTLVIDNDAFSFTVKVTSDSMTEFEIGKTLDSKLISTNINTTELKDGIVLNFNGHTAEIIGDVIFKGAGSQTFNLSYQSLKDSNTGKETQAFLANRRILLVGDMQTIDDITFTVKSGSISDFELSKSITNNNLFNGVNPLKANTLNINGCIVDISKPLTISNEAFSFKVRVTSGSMTENEIGKLLDGKILKSYIGGGGTLAEIQNGTDLVLNGNTAVIENVCGVGFKWGTYSLSYHNNGTDSYIVTRNNISPGERWGENGSLLLFQGGKGLVLQSISASMTDYEFGQALASITVPSPLSEGTLLDLGNGNVFVVDALFLQRDINYDFSFTKVMDPTGTIDLSGSIQIYPIDGDYLSIMGTPSAIKLPNLDFTTFSRTNQQGLPSNNGLYFPGITVDRPGEVRTAAPIDIEDKSFAPQSNQFLAVVANASGKDITTGESLKINNGTLSFDIQVTSGTMKDFEICKLLDNTQYPADIQEGTILTFNDHTAIIKNVNVVFPKTFLENASSITLNAGESINIDNGGLTFDVQVDSDSMDGLELCDLLDNALPSDIQEGNTLTFNNHTVTIKNVKTDVSGTLMFSYDSTRDNNTGEEIFGQLTSGKVYRKGDTFTVDNTAFTLTAKVTSDFMTAKEAADSFISKTLQIAPAPVAFQTGDEAGQTYNLPEIVYPGNWVKLFTNVSTTVNLGKAGNTLAASDINDAFADKVETFLKSVLQQVGNIGGEINRLQMKSNMISTSITGLEVAKSRILDADVAKEMLKASKLQILRQTAMIQLSQSNSLQKGLLSLFK